MDKKSLLADYVRLLDLLEDYYTDGERKNRERRPEELRLPEEVPPAPAPVSLSFGQQTTPPSREKSSATVNVNALTALTREITACTKCPLCQHRRLPVAGDGAHEPLVMIIGEAPDAEEDRMGLPFVGECGQYMDKWLNAVQWGGTKGLAQVLSRDDNTFMTPVVKCHTPDNRPPAPEELAACLPYLQRQIALLQPRAILTVGRFAPEVLLKRSESITALRGSLYRYDGIPLIATFHPAAVLHNSQLRALVWHDLKLLITTLENL